MYLLYLKICMKQIKRIVFGITLLILSTILTLRMPFALNNLLDKLFMINNIKFGEFLYSFLVYFFILIGVTIMEYFSEIYFKKIGNVNTEYLGNRFIKKIIYSKIPKGKEFDIENGLVILNDDIFNLGEDGILIIYKLIYLSMNIIALLYYMLKTQIIMSVITIGLFAVMLVVQWKGNIIIEKLIVEIRERAGDYYGIVNQLVTTHAEHINCGGAKYVQKEFLGKMKSYIEIKYRLSKKGGLLTLVNGLIIAANIVVVFIIGGWFVSRNMLTYSQLITFNTLSSGFGGYLSQIPMIFSNKKNFDVSCRRTTDFDSIDEYKFVEEKLPISDRLKISNVDYAYLGKPQIINNFTYTFKKGKMYSIVGCNGCGKSTLMKILNGDYDVDNGTIEINGKQINPHDEKLNFLEECSFFSNKSPIYKDSILNNILLGREYHEQLNEIYELLDMREWINSMEQGDLTIINDASEISDGQRQKIILARMLLQFNSIVLFDEMEKHLDRKIKLKLMNYLNVIKTKHIIIFVTHDEIIENYCDEIIRL